jgi:hypothetical protein
MSAFYIDFHLINSLLTTENWGYDWFGFTCAVSVTSYNLKYSGVYKEVKNKATFYISRPILS